MSPALDATGCVVCLEPFDPSESLVLLDGWAHISCADLVTLEPPC